MDIFEDLTDSKVAKYIFNTTCQPLCNEPGYRLYSTQTISHSFYIYTQIFSILVYFNFDYISYFFFSFLFMILFFPLLFSPDLNLAVARP